MKIISKTVLFFCLAFIAQSLHAKENQGNITSVKVEESGCTSVFQGWNIALFKSTSAIWIID